MGAEVIGKIVTCLLCLIFLVQCGEEADDSGVDVSLSPTSPVVFLSPLGVTVGGKDKTIAPPSFRFFMKIKNSSSSENLYIVAVTFTLTGTKKGVPFEGKKFAIAPSDIFDSNGDPRKLNIAELLPGQEFETEDPIFVEALPKVEDGSSDSYAYTIEGIVEAYTGKTSSEPDKNVRKRFTFVTSSPN